MSASIASLRVVTELDHVRLLRLLRLQRPGGSSIAELLDHADLVSSREVGPDIVTMNSQVRLADPQTGEERQLTLSYPADADPAAGRLSVFSPLGASLLGLRVGAQAQWRGADGTPAQAQLRGIVYQPEASGDYLR